MKTVQYFDVWKMPMDSHLEQYLLLYRLSPENEERLIEGPTGSVIDVRLPDFGGVVAWSLVRQWAFKTLLKSGLCGLGTPPPKPQPTMATGDIAAKDSGWAASPHP